MDVAVARVPVEEIVGMRELYRREMSCQIVHDSLHARGYTICHALRVDGSPAGYGCVVGFGDEPKDTVNEFFLLPSYRGSAESLFRAFIETSGASKIRAQTNDPFLTLMLFDTATDVHRESVLFHDSFTSNLSSTASFRRTMDDDRVRSFHRRPEDTGDWLLEDSGEIVATGGILCHYNPPYGDLYMEVAEGERRRGYGSYLVQELKRACYETGSVPAARCDPANAASRATLQKAGMLPCGSILLARIDA